METSWLLKASSILLGPNPIDVGDEQEESLLLSWIPSQSSAEPSGLTTAVLQQKADHHRSLHVDPGRHHPSQ
ncbi:hypothetical protein Y1Q_0012006 [Alligator mississippiensis]|uniref:Uncharacterized protein n=1 Tax=Alligator mississippiensis TaxID=8496 RepID=A0A151NGT2_ALLMI|nr:hypothetical protein Y1Q_0012006 [Alligator mississippiensis]